MAHVYFASRFIHICRGKGEGGAGIELSRAALVQDCRKKNVSRWEK